MKMIFKRISVLLALTMTAPIISISAEPAREMIYNEIYLLKDSEYDSVSQAFTTLDLRGVANRDFMDEVEGDHKGGWSDQGTNDLRDFKERGITKFKNIPFDIIDPEQNDGKSVLVLRGQGEIVLPYEVEIPINAEAKGVYFLHTTAYGMGEGTVEAEYSFIYEDGSSATMELRDMMHLRDFWGAADYEYYQTAWKTIRKSDNREISFGVFALYNPHPEKKIKSLHLATTNNGGGAYVMILGITLTNNGPYLPDMNLSNPVNPSTVNWIKTEGKSVTEETALDSSFLADAPAGKHGKLINKDGKLTFENGTDARFWGVNLSLQDSLADKEIRDKIVGGISKCGYNLVRFNDIPKVLTDKQKETLAYLIESLAEKGIYSYLCLNNDGRVSDFFMKESLDTQAAHIRDILSIKTSNGKTLAENNAVAMLEFVNGCSLMDYSAGYDYGYLLENEKAELERLFNEYLTKYKGKNLSDVWAGEGVALNEWESLDKGNIELPGSWRYSLYTDNRKRDIREFMAELQHKAYLNLSDVAANVGYGGLCTMNSNKWEENTSADSYANSKSGFVARNIMWANPYGSRKYGEKAWVYNYSPMIFNENLGVIGEAAASDYSGTPLVVSEWNSAISNPYYSQTQLMMGYFAATQGWTPIMYTYMQDEYSSENILTDFYSVYNNPANKVLASAISRMYFAIEESDKINETQISKDDILKENKIVMTSEFLNGRSKLMASDTDMKKPNSRIGSIIRRDNMYMDRDKGTFMVDTDAVQAFSGFIDGRFNLSNISCELENDFATVILTSNEQKKLSQSDSLLLSVIGGVRNSTMEYSGNLVRNIGHSPVIAEAISGRITLKLNGDYDIYTLSESGERVEKISSYRNKNGEIIFNINKYYQSSSQRACNYEIVRRGK